MDATKKLIAAAFVAFLSASAVASLNCEKPGGRAETRICEIQEKGAHKDFLSLDASLNVEYRRALESTDDKRKLRTDQRAWIAQRNRCDSEKCFRELYTKRIHELSEIARSNARFEGRWERCFIWRAEKICENFDLVQEGPRVCGEWSYWASGRFYEGRLLAHQLDEKRSGWLRSCGPPGHRTKTECGAENESTGAWARTDGEFQLCGGSLYVLEGEALKITATCSHMDKRDAFQRVPVLAERHSRLNNQPWLRNCLVE